MSLLRKKGKIENIENYDHKLEIIRAVLEEAQARGAAPLSYQEIGEKTTLTGEDVHKLVGRRFVELTKGAYKNVAALGDADPDFYLFGDQIKEISENSYYKTLRGSIAKAVKYSQKLANIRGGKA